jgi:hypothetical protein
MSEAGKLARQGSMDATDNDIISPRNNRSQSNAAGLFDIRRNMRDNIKAISTSSIATKSAPKLPSENTRIIEEDAFDLSSIPNINPQLTWHQHVQAIFEHTNVQKILSDELPAPLDYETFLQFCIATYCAENVRFWTEMRMFQTTVFSDYTTFSKEMTRLLNTYMNTKATDELNLPNNITDNIHAEIENIQQSSLINTNVFNSALDHITRLMNNDTLPRFRRMILVNVTRG